MTDRSLFRVGVTTHPNPDLTSPYFSVCFAGLEAALRKISFHLNPSPLAVDGWVLLAPSEGQWRRVQQTGLPAVVVNGRVDGLPSIDLDNVGAAREMATHLINRGHRRIGFIAGKSESSNARDREVGYRAVLVEQGISIDPDLILEGRFDRAGGERAMERLLELSLPPTAIFAANDHMALGAWDALKKRNRAVPTDFLLAGFDDIPEAETAGLTSVVQPLESMAIQAGEWLRDWIQTGQRPPVDLVHIPGQVVVRKSTCPQGHIH